MVRVKTVPGVLSQQGEYTLDAAAGSTTVAVSLGRSPGSLSY